jgi:excisionase family DNA binding protein
MCPENMWCEYHDGPVDWSTFEWKGCWGCYHFCGLLSNYLYVSDAAEILGVSEATIRRWIKEGILKATLYRRGRRIFTSSPPKRYVITRKSVDDVGAIRNKSGTMVGHLSK